MENSNTGFTKEKLTFHSNTVNTPIPLLLQFIRLYNYNPLVPNVPFLYPLRAGGKGGTEAEGKQIKSCRMVGFSNGEWRSYFLFVIFYIVSYFKFPERTKSTVICIF